MNKLEQAARALLAHWDTPAWKYLKTTSDLMADLRKSLAEQAEQIPQKERKDFIDGYNAGMADAKRMQQAEHEPVAKIALKNCIYFDSIDFNQTPPYLRYDTGDSTPKENWTVYCDIQEDLRKNGYELTDSDVDHDTVCGDVTPMAAPVRTKDLTEYELDELRFQNLNYLDYARAVIAKDREKNNANNNT